MPECLDFYKPSNLYTKNRIIYAIKRIIGHTQRNVYEHCGIEYGGQRSRYNLYARVEGESLEIEATLTNQHCVYIVSPLQHCVYIVSDHLYYCTYCTDGHAGPNRAENVTLIIL